MTQSFKRVEKRMHSIQKHLLSSPEKSYYLLSRNVGGNSRLYKWLKDNGITKKGHNGFIIWNPAVPVSGVLINKYLEYNRQATEASKASSNKVPTKKVTRTRKSKKTTTPTKEWSREVSLFWGLIKFKI